MIALAVRHDGEWLQKDGPDFHDRGSDPSDLLNTLKASGIEKGISGLNEICVLKWIAFQLLLDGENQPGFELPVDPRGGIDEPDFRVGRGSFVADSRLKAWHAEHQGGTYARAAQYQEDRSEMPAMRRPFLVQDSIPHRMPK